MQNNLKHSKEEALHVKAFKVKPNIIGMFWDDPEAVRLGIIKAIQDKKPYNEYNLLSDDGKTAYDNGSLLF